VDMNLKNPGASSGCVSKNSGGSTSTDVRWHGDWSKDSTGAQCVNGGGGSGITRWWFDRVDFTGWGIDARIKGGVALQSIRKIDCPGLSYGTAAPVWDAWCPGDVVWHSAPAASTTPGWVCVTAGQFNGTSGAAVFKAMANLAA
jgi:hypothetical protein